MTGIKKTGGFVTFDGEMPYFGCIIGGEWMYNSVIWGREDRKIYKSHKNATATGELFI